MNRQLNLYIGKYVWNWWVRRDMVLTMLIALDALCLVVALLLWASGSATAMLCPSGVSILLVAAPVVSFVKVQRTLYEKQNEANVSAVNDAWGKWLSKMGSPNIAKAQAEAFVIALKRALLHNPKLEKMYRYIAAEKYGARVEIVTPDFNVLAEKNEGTVKPVYIEKVIRFTYLFQGEPIVVEEKLFAFSSEA